MKQDNACRSGTRRYLAQPGPGLCLHSTEHLTPSLAGSDNRQVPSPPESRAGHSCPHRNGFNFP